MNTWLSVVALIMRATWNSVTVDGGVVVQEVRAGHLIELPCLSSDNQHRFMFWELSGDKNIISPGNPINQNKYKYEVLSGKLLIKSVSTAESGFYKCFSMGITDDTALNVQTVELIVRKDWEDVWENDFETNLLRGLTAAMVLIVAVAVVLYIITNKRHRTGRYYDMDTSRENSPSDYRNGPLEGAGSSSPLGVQGIDNSPVDVDFPQVFTKMHQDQAVRIS
ncbi:uncharacterized protein LOC105691280 [Athalia rosae]|uniref:uncharacterized protein LOC105691280 n=1 Tax=Athalia rosae TaxID=37344 RepID=UPI000625D6F2|nr:uncharacterized protein LOC105691280 [Athalia rosae]XP_048512135.1 uncharacterized protein LOC105691280 [Athalia rosae]XP_048512136.1 uncharacterized protein LOC105691280 [Athalia rosae]